MISTWFGKKPDKAQLDWIRLLSADCPQITRQRISDATSDIDLRDSFGMTGPPTLFAVGKRDQATPARISTRMAAAVPGATIEVFKDSGHMVLIEEPQALARRLHTWFDDVEGRTQRR